MNLNLTFGGSYSFDEDDNYVLDYSLMSWDHMPKYETTNWRVFGRMTQKFGTQEEDDEESASTIKNAFYTIQADYSKFKGEYNPIDDCASLFRLGYVGKFNNYKDRFYIDSVVNGDPQQAIATQVAFFDTLFTFQQNGGSEDLADYTESYFDLYQENIGTIRNQFQLQGLGLLNGGAPPVFIHCGQILVLKLVSLPSEATQLGVKMHASADIEIMRYHLVLNTNKERIATGECPVPLPGD